MPKLNWWQWTLVVVVALGIIGAIGNALPAEPTPPPQPRIISDRTIDSSSHVYGVLLEKGAPRASLDDRARKLCGSADYCSVAGWTDPELVAKGFPFTEREAAGISYSYAVNRSNGEEKSLVRCSDYPGTPAAQCF